MCKTSYCIKMLSFCVVLPPALSASINMPNPDFRLTVTSFLRGRFRSHPTSHMTGPVYLSARLLLHSLLSPSPFPFIFFLGADLSRRARAAAAGALERRRGGGGGRVAWPRVDAAAGRPRPGGAAAGRCVGGAAAAEWCGGGGRWWGGRRHSNRFSFFSFFPFVSFFFFYSKNLYLSFLCKFFS